MKRKLLIIEDDEQIVEAVSLAFQIRWREAEIISTRYGKKGVELVASEQPDVVVLDLGLPDTSGFDVLREIRRFSDVPIIIVTVRAEEADIIKGLEWGADDYIIKPFRQMELVARIKAQTRRPGQTEQEELASGPLHLNSTTGQLIRDNKKIDLTVTESKILGHLMRNAGHVVTHSSIAEAVWGDDYPAAAETLRVHIRRLREKIERDPSNPEFVVTRPGVGYLLSSQ
ncbi:MAG: response regulator transcription factor [Dehalococcoidia bacterium]|nr:response regulator transcription factor [Dehalococcoidia bacterium]